MKKPYNIFLKLAKLWQIVKNFEKIMKNLVKNYVYNFEKNI